MNKKTFVLGASDNPSRYSYLALNMLQSKGHEVTAIGRRTGKVGELKLKLNKKILRILIQLHFTLILLIKDNITITYFSASKADYF